METDIKVTIELAENLGLTKDEFSRIKELLAREPNFTDD